MLERDDIQGIITSAYPRLMFARYVFLRRDDATDLEAKEFEAAAREWLRSLVPRVRTADERFRDATTGINIGLTCTGLKRIGMPMDALRTFPREYRQGMWHADRAITLGDVGRSAPAHWMFGGTHETTVDVVLMLFASKPAELEALVRSSCDPASLRVGRMNVAHTIETRALEAEKEHFGFRDGIAQPLVEGFSGSRITDDGFPADYPHERRIKTGEFILGYDNEYGVPPHSPSLASDDDPDGVLQPLPRSEGTRRDLGQNGSFLVVRQLHQDVAGFWSYCRRVSRDDRGARDLAEKMVGRTLDGRPLADLGAGDGPFGYREDLAGRGCPVGAHVRRANPRDALPGGIADSLVVSRRHRILRRGRSYGAPLDDPTRDDGAERGLVFICLNANLRRQFELIQQAWVANPKFARLADEDDPIIGQRAFTDRVFSIPGEPARRRVGDLPTFVTLRGGGYFFLPGKRVLTYLAQGGADD